MAQERRRFSEPSDGFFFDVQDWTASRPAQRMSFSQRGVYLELLFYQWKQRNIPDDPYQAAEMICMTADQRAEAIAAWDVVRAQFVPCKGDPTRVYNVRLERTRRAQLANLRKHQNAGRAAGLASARKRQKTHELASNERSTFVDERQQKRREETRREEKRHTVRAQPDRMFGNEHRNHAACGRACVPAFLHRELRKALGGNEQQADDTLRDWYLAVESLFADDDPVPADVLGFWRKRFDAEFVKPSLATKSDQQQAAELTAEIERQNRAVQR